MQRIRLLPVLAVVLAALVVLFGPRDVLPADAGSDRVVFYQYALPLDPSVTSWRLETDRTRDQPAMGIRLRGRTASGRLRGDFSIARGVLERAAAEAENSPRGTPSSVALAYDLLRDREVGEQSRVTVTVQGNREEKMVKDVAGSAAVNLVLAIFPWLESGGATSAKVGVGLSRIRRLMAQGTGGGEREVSTTMHTVGAQWSERWLTVDYRFTFPGSDHARDDRPSTLQLLAASFQPDPRFTLGGSCKLEATARSCSVNAVLAKTFDLVVPFRLPVDLYAMPSFAAMRYRSGPTEVASNYWSVDGGLSLRF